MQTSYFGDSGRQAALNRLKDIVGPSRNMLDIYPNAINCEQIIANNTNGYTFPITQKNMDTQNLPLQIGLIESDFFMMYEMAICLSKRTIASPGNGAPKLWQFPNPDVFTGGAAGVAADLEAFYNSKLSLKVSTTNKINSWYTQEFLNQPFGTAAIVATPPAAGTPNTVANTIYYNRRIIYTATAGVILLGSNDNNFTLDLKSVGTVADTGGTSNNVVTILANGFKIPQGTNAYEAVQNYLAAGGQ